VAIAFPAIEPSAPTGIGDDKAHEHLFEREVVVDDAQLVLERHRFRLRRLQ